MTRFATRVFAKSSRHRRVRRTTEYRGRRLRLESLEPRNLLTAELLSISSFPGVSAAGTGVSSNPAISSSGRYVAFQSLATDLASGVSDANGGADVFVRDTLLDVTVLISVVPTGGRTGDDASFDPAISEDGRFVAFVSEATNLVKDGIIDSLTNVYVRDRDLDRNGIFDEPGAGKTITRLLSVAIDGTSGDGPSGGGTALFPSSLTRRPVISGNGKFVAFGSLATDLALTEPSLTDFNGAEADIFRASTGGGPVALVSLNAAGTGSGTGPFGSASLNPSISGDGSLVAFESSAANLVPSAAGGIVDDNLDVDIFVGTGKATTLVSVNADEDGSPAGASREPMINRSGTHVVFISKGTDLVRGVSDVNGLAEDVFVRDLRAGKTTLISRSREPGPVRTGSGPSPAGPGSDGFLGGPVISDSGRFIAFQSSATDLLDPADGVTDTNAKPDIFWFDRDSDENGVLDEVGGTITRLVSVNSLGTASTAVALGSPGSFSPAISGDGRFVAFSSTGSDLIPGVAGTQVYLRDMVTGAITLISSTISGDEGGSGLTTGRLVALSRSGDSVSFISPTLAPDLDPLVTSDTNGGLDVFLGAAPPEILAGATVAEGGLSGSARYSIARGPLAPFEISLYRSSDALLDAGDELLGSIPVTDPDDLVVGRRSQPFVLGAAPAAIPFPGVTGGVSETSADYFLLSVMDAADVIGEFDGDPVAEDNTGYFSLAYHEPGGPVLVHGRERATPSLSADTITVASTSSELTLTFAGAASGVQKFPLADVTSFRIRAHGGDDSVLGSDLPDVIWGGAGADKLTGGAGDDLLDGGPGDDVLIGGPGADLFLDGPGDDLVFSDEEDEEVIATPGSDDVFSDAGGSDTLNFSRDDQPITLDLDSSAVQTVDPPGNTVQLLGQWENYVGSPHGNRLFVRPLPVARTLVGGTGLNDVLIVDALGLPVTYDGSRFHFPGLGDIVVTGFETLQTINAAPRVIDNSDPAPAFSAPGFFPSSPQFPQGFRDGVHFSAANSGNVATWQFRDLAPGLYQIAATWTFAGDRAKNSPFTFRDGDINAPILRTLLLNQEQNPGEFDPPDDGEDVLFRNLTIVRVTGNLLTVQLSDVGADQFVAADAIRIEQMGRDFVQVLDNGDDGYSSNCPVVVLANNGANRGAYGDSALCTLDSHEAQWTFAAVPPGRYRISATWVADASLPDSANFQVVSGSSTQNVELNQQIPPDDFVWGGSNFEPLGVFDLFPGPMVVYMGGSGKADALLLETAPLIRVQTDGRHLEGATPITAGDEWTAPDAVLEAEVPQANDRYRFEYDNWGTASLRVTQIEVTGAGFQLANPGPFPVILPPGGSAAFELEFTGTTAGEFRGQVSIRSNGHPSGVFGFQIRQPVVVDEAPPEVEIVHPAPGTAVIEGSSILIQAEVQDDLGIQRVEFQGCEQCPVVSDSEAPFSAMVSVPLQVASTQIRVAAIDRSGRRTAAEPVELAVLDDQPPVVTLLSPPTGTTFPVETQSVTIEVAATDDLGVQRVEFRACPQCEVLTAWEEPYIFTAAVPPEGATINPVIQAIDVSGQAKVLTPVYQKLSSPISAQPGVVLFGIRSSSETDLASRVAVVEPTKTGIRELFRTFPFGSEFSLGVQVALGDLNQDGAFEVVTGAAGGAPHVKVFDGATGIQLHSFFAFAPETTNGVTVAVGDVNRDGADDLIVGAGRGSRGGEVKIFDGLTGGQIVSFLAFPESFVGGVRVSAGDVDGDGFDEVIVGAGPGGTASQVLVRGGPTAAQEIKRFAPFGGAYQHGVEVTVGDLNHDGTEEIVVSADQPTEVSLGKPVRVFDGISGSAIDSFFAFAGIVSAGSALGIGDANGDGRNELLVGSALGLPPQVELLTGIVPHASRGSLVLADATQTGGVRVAGVKAAAPRRLELPAGGGTFALNAEGSDFLLRREGGEVIQRGPLAGQPLLVVHGTDGSSDTLTVNTEGLATQIAFLGGAQGFDTLIIQGTAEGRINHLLAGPDSGVIQFSSRQISYSGLEPIVDELAAVDREFWNRTSGDQRWSLSSVTPAAGSLLMLQPLGSQAFESIAFPAPSGTLTLQSLAGNDELAVTTLPAKLVHLASTGSDLLRFTGSGLHLDLVNSATNTLRDLEAIDLTGSGANSLAVTAAAVRSIAGHDQPFALRYDSNDTVTFDSGWVGGMREELGSETRHHFSQAGAVLQITNARRWQNPTSRYDVNADGFVVPLDMLRIVNVLNTLGAIDLRTLPAGFSISYVDVQGDDFVTPLDALTVVNVLNAAAGEGETDGNFTVRPASGSGTIPVNSSAFVLTLPNDPRWSGGAIGDEIETFDRPRAEFSAPSEYAQLVPRTRNHGCVTESTGPGVLGVHRTDESEETMDSEHDLDWETLVDRLAHELYRR